MDDKDKLLKKICIALQSIQKELHEMNKILRDKPEQEDYTDGYSGKRRIP